MVVYRFLKFGTREEHTFNSIEEALSVAFDDMNTGSAAPLEILEDGAVLMTHGIIRQKFHQIVDNLLTPVDSPSHKPNGDSST